MIAGDTISIDPGIRGCGVALWHASFSSWTLERAYYVKNPIEAGDGVYAVLAMATAIEAVSIRYPVIEWPRVYTAGKLKGDPNDLLPLVAIGIALCARFGAGTRYFPHEWKGQMKKEQTEERIRSRLSESELSCVEATGHKGHNVWDAVGLGLWHFERFNRKRVIAR